MEPSNPSKYTPTHNKEHHLHGGGFHNPFPTWKDPSATGLIKWITTRKPPSFPPPEMFQLVKPNWDFLLLKEIYGPQRIRNTLSLTWVGHSTFYCTLDGVGFLTDPVWGNRCSPVSFAGPERYVKTPCAISDFPKIDFVLISHNHYDHLDSGVVSALGNSTTWIVPLGLKSWFASCGVDSVVELDWWDSYKVNEEITVTAVPCQHWSKRSVMDRNATLWASYAVVGPVHKAYFAGDTGYCDAFAEIGETFGPFDLALIPIGAYEPRDFMGPQHVDPEEAVKMHMDLRSKFSVGMHWGTFILTDEPVDEPPKKLQEALAKHKLPVTSFIACLHGQTIIREDLPRPQPSPSPTQ
eukprot:TRINITY_DN8691_c0_g1_i1.p1 TRINITY_DN8691_c0_g1~~TRINITY_DN8691_c0_g1_i1.p1  ORF type:complete len:352 (+),score=60.09 TRINITY_DN8691_c0_g1_i1:46-1101(+)